MKIQGLNVDAAAIAAGLYAIIVERGEENLVAFGMIPKWIMDLLEKQLNEKLIEIAAKQNGIDPAFVRANIDPEKLKSLRNPIIKEIASEIYGAAKAAGKMVV